MSSHFAMPHGSAKAARRKILSPRGGPPAVAIRSRFLAGERKDLNDGNAGVSLRNVTPLQPLAFPFSMSRFPARLLRSLRHSGVLPALLLLVAGGFAGLPGLRAQVHRIPAATPGLLEAGAPPFAVVGAEGLGLGSPPTDLHLLPDGRLLALAYPQIAIGDGLRWETFSQAPTDQPLSAAGCAVDADGAIYLAMPRGFGRVEFGADGFWRLRFVASWPADSDPQRAVPRAASIVGDEWIWHSGSGALISWRPGQPARNIGTADSFEYAFALGGATYLSDRTDGRLARFEAGGGMTPVLAYGSMSASDVITSSTPFDARNALVGSYSRGVQLFDGTAVHAFAKTGVLAGGLRVNDVCATEGDMFAAAIENYGVVFFDREGRTVQVLERSGDHRLARVQRLLPAPGGVIWGLVEGGILRLEFPSRISNVEALLGTGATSIHPTRLDGQLWLLADGRIYRGHYEPDGRLSRLELDSPSTHDVFALSCAPGIAIAGRDRGAFYRATTGWVEFAPDINNLRIVDQNPINGRWLYCARNEMGWLRPTADGIDVERISAPGLPIVFNSVTDARGDIWLELGAARYGRIRLIDGRPSLRMFGPADGVLNGWAQVYVIDGVAGFNVADQILRFDEATQRFTIDEDFPRRYPGIEDVVGRPGRDSSGRLWIAANGKILVLDTSGGQIRDLGEKLPPGFRPYYLTFEDGGVVWLHSDRRLVRYDPKMPVPTPASLRALITHLTVATSNRSIFAVDRALPPFHFADNSLIAHFVAPGNPFAAPVTFEVKLEGAGSEWAPVGGGGSAVFNRLKEGSYVLHVRPTSGGVAGAEATLAFSIRPPWFRSPLAYATYGVSAVALVLLIGRLLSYLQRRENARLELLVAQRTRELNASNDRLASQVEEIRMLSQAIEQSPVAVFITKPDGTIEFANPRACQLTGYSAAELIAQNIHRHRSAPLAPETEAEIAAALARGQPWHGQYTDRHQDGREVPVRVMIGAIRGPAGDVRHHLLLKEDVTEWLSEQDRRRRLEAQLFQAQKQESIGTLAGGIAHDFNNILTGILGYCELARISAGENADLQRDLNQIRASGLRAKDLVAQILTFSRQSNPQLVPLDLTEPVAEALKLIRATTPATIEITATLESGMVRADATQIQQVVLNLCTNATHAMKDRAGRLDLAVQRLTVDRALAAEVSNLSPGPWLRLTVRDNGRGMDPTTLGRIFDPFFTTKRQGEGTGLGLAIVQGIVAGHQGALRVRSEIDVGTTFEVYLPVTTEARKPAAPAAPAPRGNQQSVIVVDDEETVAHFVATRLRQLGYEPTVFCEPLDALHAFAATPHRFHALVTDLTMPHLTGADLVQQIRSRGWLIPAVIITGYGGDGVRGNLNTLPCCTLLQKPFSGDELARALDRVLNAGASPHRP
jgi:PAS domain S-box-containing protein